MKNLYTAYLCLGLCSTALLLALLQFFKPDEALQPAPALRIQSAPLQIQPADEAAAAVQPIPAVQDQTALLQERDTLYQEFARISTQLSHGQAVDERDVEGLLLRQLQLLQAGALSQQDAVSSSEFLLQILPEMKDRLERHILLLKKASS